MRDMLLSGQSLRKEHIEVLAGVVGGELGDRLREAATHNNSIMALSMADCEQLLVVLEDAPWSLIALRETLLAQREQRQRKRVREQKVVAYRRAHGLLPLRGPIDF